MSLTPNAEPNFNCPKCGSYHFTQVFYLKMVPGLMVGAKQTVFKPLPVIVCAKCGYEPTAADGDVQLREKSGVHPSLITPPKPGEA